MWKAVLLEKEIWSSSPTLRPLPFEEENTAEMGQDKSNIVRSCVLFINLLWEALWLLVLFIYFCFPFSGFLCSIPGRDTCRKTQEVTRERRITTRVVTMWWLVITLSLGSAREKVGFAFHSGTMRSTVCLKEQASLSSVYSSIRGGFSSEIYVLFLFCPPLHNPRQQTSCFSTRELFYVSSIYSFPGVFYDLSLQGTFL